MSCTLWNLVTYVQAEWVSPFSAVQIEASLALQISKSIDLKKKEVEDVLGGPDSWKGAPKSDATCEKCGYHQAYFNEIQIRSADEPATLFFKCVKCGNQWREG